MGFYRYPGLKRMAMRLSDEIHALQLKLLTNLDEAAHNRAHIQEALADLNWAHIAFRRAITHLNKCRKK